MKQVVNCLLPIRAWNRDALLIFTLVNKSQKEIINIAKQQTNKYIDFEMGLSSHNPSLLCLVCLIGVFSMAISFPSKTKARPKTVNPSKKEFAKDFSMVGQDLKGCKYNEKDISHGTIAYQDVCGKFTCTDGYMAWYFFPNARMFDICHVPAPLIKPFDNHLVMDNIPVYATKSTGEKMERVSVIGGPTHGFVDHADEAEGHDAHSAVMQTTTIDVKAAHEPHGQPTVEVHDPVVHTGAISITDHGGHHGEVVTNSK